jgi:hypothetical protein
MTVLFTAKTVYDIFISMSDDISEYTASQDEKSSVSKEKLVISKRNKNNFLYQKFK